MSLNNVTEISAQKKRISFLQKPSQGDIIKIYLDKKLVTYGVAVAVETIFEARICKRAKGEQRWLEEVIFEIEKVVVKETTGKFDLCDCDFCLDAEKVLFI